MLVSPQAVQLRIHFCVKENQLCCTSLRDLIKDINEMQKEKKKAQHRLELSPHPQEFYSAGCALPLCYNGCRCTCYVKKSIFVQVPEVPASHPAVLGHVLLVAVVPVEVAHHHVPAPHQDLTLALRVRLRNPAQIFLPG